MNLTMTTNAPELAAWWDSFVAQHKSKPGSALRDSNKVRWVLSLTNEATATNAAGETFSYFDAVDKGRKAVNARPGGWLVFGSRRNPVFTKSVAAAPGLNITAKSMAVIYAQYPAELNLALEARSLQRLGVGDIKPAEIIREANKAARAARTPGRNRSRIFRVSNNDSINRLIRLPNWLPIANTFNRVVLKQVDVFKSKTPLRRAGDLHYVGKGTVELLAHDPTHLRTSYVLTPNSALALLVPSKSTAPKNNFKLTKTQEL